MNALVHTSKIKRLYQDIARLPLHDVEIAVKDNICTASMPTTCSSEMLLGFLSPFDATVVDNLIKSGARIVGKTNCDEFGMGSLNVHSIHGPVVNPHMAPSSTTPWAHREQRSAGGSSGGSAAAVAANLCHAALSTDTGGSTRLPASYCGVAGLKPSYGLISRWGVVSFADSLDCVGVMATTINLVRRVFDIVSHHDPQDPTSATPETRRKASNASLQRSKQWNSRQGDLTGLRIGVPQEYFPSELDPSVIRPIRRILKTLKTRGASVIPVSLPSTSYALSAYYVIASAEASSNMARFDGIQYGLHVTPSHDSDRKKISNVYAHTRSRGFGREVQRRILLGTYALTADAFDNYFLQAQKVRKLIRADFNRVFRSPNFLSSSPSENPSKEGVDVLIHPSAIRTAPLLSDSSLTGLQSYVQDVLTVPASLAGLPALSVPAGLAEDGWPVGVCIVGQWGFDEMVLEIGEVIENRNLEKESCSIT